MAESLKDRLEHAWNVFRGRDNIDPLIPQGGVITYGHRPDRARNTHFSRGQIIAPILNQIAIDAAGIVIKHVRVGDEGEYREDMVSPLNHSFTTWPNLDQGPTQFRQDVIMTMLEEGIAAVVPVVTSDNPSDTGGYDIYDLRVGIIKTWIPPDRVRVELYDERVGYRREVVVYRKDIAIVENPLFTIMNAPNSTLQRLGKKLDQLDITDDRFASGKLDILVQLPYTIKHQTRLAEARQRITDIESQMQGNRLGIGYIDATERVVQLNRPSENNLLSQVVDLEKRVYSQMGLTEEIFFGTASEEAMLNYHNRTVFPIVRAIQEEYRRKFLTKTAMTRGQSIVYVNDPFKLVPVGQIAEIADKFLRNEIMSPNEFRPIVGRRPVDDPDADELRNRNMPKVDPVTEEEPPEPEPEPEQEEQPEKEISKGKTR